MLKNHAFRVATLALALALGATGCAHKSKMSKGTASIPGLGADPWGRSEAELRAARVYHFGFDRYDLSEKDLYAVRAQAYFLKDTPQKVTVSGYTDNRGSREYNIALGERRAKAVAETLQQNGLSREHVRTVSYGKERPVNPENNEAAWAENRRAVLSYDGQDAE